ILSMSLKIACLSSSLNLPKEIILKTTRIKKNCYIYNALGQKVRKVINNGLKTTTTGYQSGFHYEDEVLSFFATAEGYVNVLTKGNKTSYNYVYNYTDHLVIFE